MIPFVLPCGQNYKLPEMLQVVLFMKENIAMVLFTLITYFPTWVMSAVEMLHSGSSAQKLAALEVIFSLLPFVSLCIWLGLLVSHTQNINPISDWFGNQHSVYRIVSHITKLLLVVGIKSVVLSAGRKIYLLPLINGSDIYQCGIHYPSQQNNHTSYRTTPSFIGSVTLY